MTKHDITLQIFLTSPLHGRDRVKKQSVNAYCIWIAKITKKSIRSPNEQIILILIAGIELPLAILLLSFIVIIVEQ